MNQLKPDYAAIEAHIRRARLEQSAAIGDAISDGIVALWNGIARACTWLSHHTRAQAKAHAGSVRAINETPCDYTPSIPRHY